ncbi:MFS transporter [Lysobacter yananisis]|uniref:MFS transporter n=1 Tax=Lysobacter yananisis TaxID=1003114 RepID=A0ABY9P6R8_9GAMM|nr:MFS transporter [Lysobacter yananisis]WMT02748.1 MFS transporter [Lysobacter yananisis]
MNAAAQAAPRTAARLPGLTLLAACFGFMVVQLDVTIVNLALPTLAADLASELPDLQWVMDAYTLMFAALLLSAGALSDRIGARRSFLLGLGGFLLASLGCGLAASAAQLIAARAGQGLFAALMVPSSLALLNHAFAHDPPKRARAMAVWTASGAVAATLGSVAGGALLQSLGWRSIFLVNLPICAIGIALAWRIAETPRRPERRFDIAGQLLAVAALAGLIAAIIELPRLGPGHPIVLGAAATAIVCALAFVAVESRTHEPMLPLALFRLPGLSIALLTAIAVAVAYYALLFAMSLYLQQRAGYTPFQAGLAYVPLAASFIAANLLSGRLLARRGFRFALLLGLLLCAAGFAWLSRLAPGDHYAWILPAFIAIPAGMGLAMPATTTLVLASVERSLSATAAAVLNASRQTGAALGVAVCGLLLIGDGGLGVGLRTVCHVAAGVLLAAAVLAWTCLPATGAAKPATT